MDEQLTSRFVPEGERVVLRVKPSAWSIVLGAMWPIVIDVVIAVVLFANAHQSVWAGWIAWAFVLAVGIRLAWGSLKWWSREYVLTERRVVRATGVLRRHVADVQLDRIQNVVVHRLLRERVFGLGTIGFASAGTDSYEAVWLMVPDPDRMLDTIRRSMSTPSRDNDEQPAGSRLHREPLVIGLAGGIGAGKSTVAQAFADLGCVVSDSDTLAREALDRVDVRARLVEWWGDVVLNDEGRIDRSRVAEIVFADPSQRERLERLVHPIVRASREELIKAAQLAGAPAVIVDAPLLFEAGLDADCDTVVFVDAPPEVRRARVMGSRGWDADELAKRESAQWPASDKRARAEFIVENSGDLVGLRAEVSTILGRIVDAGGSTGAREPK